ncbi:MAG: hypothetical protein HYY17_16205 [Planctomycetes bacterium]|nr:hypothetical protein [Planctomycetota bacterium]
MIYFYCPECREELEAEDSIKSTKMRCPACWKEIVVPEVGIALPPGRKAARPVGEPAERSVGPRIFLVTVVVVVLGLAGWFGVRHFLAKRQEAARPKCTACAGKGTQTCRDCRGAKMFPCKGECKGTGKVIHQPGNEETNCSDCAGTARTPCRTCGGSGGYGCERCQGTGEPAR